MISEDLRRRLLVTVATSLGLYGCAERTPPAPNNVLVSGVDGSTLAVEEAAPASETADTTAPPKTRACAAGSKPERYCLKSGTSPTPIMQAPSPTPPPRDADGCVAASLMRDKCNGIDDVLAGPTAAGGQCCYQVCQMAVPLPCGRPLVIDGSNRSAPVVRAGARVLELGSELRLALRDAWLADGQMEHASVASFARFTLELLAVGAPAEFLAEAQRAGVDEVAHAQACFALAQRCDPAGASFVAGAIDLSGLVIRTSLADVAAAAVEEACCGETFAALALLRASAACTDPRVKPVLERIAEDEARHAELGYRFVVWAIATGGEPILEVVRAAFARGIAQLRAGAPRGAALDAQYALAWMRAGRLTEEELAITRREACASVIAPAARLVLGG